MRRPIGRLLAQSRGGIACASKSEEKKMDELVKQISAKVGISEAQAKSAVEMVANFLKQKLPGPLAGQVDAALGAAGSAAGKVDVGNIASGLGGLFGKK